MSFSMNRYNMQIYHSNRPYLVLDHHLSMSYDKEQASFQNQPHPSF